MRLRLQRAVFVVGLVLLRELVSVFIVAPLEAQVSNTGSAAPRFEVVSIKAAAHPDLPNWRITGGPGTSDPGHFICIGAPLLPLIGISYELKPYQLTGPASIQSIAYDIVAKVPPGTTHEQFLLMVRTLLAERFDLKFHWEPRKMPVYELVVAKGGTKLREAAPPIHGASPHDPRRVPFPRDDNGVPVLPPGVPALMGFREGGNVRYVARMQPLGGNFLVNLEGLAGRPVVDRTGLTGVYDFNLVFRPEPINVFGAEPSPNPSALSPLADAAGEPAPDLFIALQNQLGLKLQSAKAPVPVFVVDSVAKNPNQD